MSLFNKLFLLGFLSAASWSAMAETPVFELEIKNNRFNPTTLNVPTGKKIKLVVHNNDASPEEFESYQLNREKIIPGNSKAIVFIGPLEAGEYPFFGEFHYSTAQGKIIAK